MLGCEGPAATAGAGSSVPPARAASATGITSRIDVMDVLRAIRHDILHSLFEFSNAWGLEPLGGHDGAAQGREARDVSSVAAHVGSLLGWRRSRRGRTRVPC